MGKEAGCAVDSTFQRADVVRVSAELQEAMIRITIATAFRRSATLFVSPSKPNQPDSPKRKCQSNLP